MIIIPAIDIINGKCVRLTKGDYTQQKIYNNNPVDIAKRFADAGLQRLHIVDLDGAKLGAVQNIKVLESIANETNLVIDFGGGIKTLTDVQAVLNAGATYVTVGSLAVINIELLKEWIKEIGADKFLIAADVLNEQIKINGWLKDGGLNIFDFIEQMTQIGIKNIFCTDISKDGMMQGPSIELYKKIIYQYPQLNFIASGGVSSMDDVHQLKNIGCSGVIIGKAIYENLISLKELQSINQQL